MERMEWIICEYMFFRVEKEITMFVLNYMLPWTWQCVAMMLSALQL